MRTIVQAVRTYLLCKLPVPRARRALKRIHPADGTQPDATAERQLLIDISTIVRNDDRTGIQRVVRALLLQLISRPPAGFRVRPVFATRKQGYHYAHETGDPARLTARPTAASAISARSGDIFLCLDLAAQILPRHAAELAHWKQLGVEIDVIVYDLLPVLHPSWFNARNTRNIRRWLRTIAILADRLICISPAVKTDLENWLLRKYGVAAGVIPACVIPLGADIDASMPSRGVPENIDALMQTLFRKPAVLMVGTIEPRKSHGVVLAAFHEQWRKGLDVNLVIIGKPGWKTHALQQALRANPEHNRRLHWLEDASDDLLMLLYARCTGVIVASYAEGFGLSFIEALYYQKPVLARDLPVFRDTGGDFATYFSGDEGLAQALASWLANIESGRVPAGGPRYTWQNSASALCRCLGIRQSAAPLPSQTDLQAPALREITA